MLQNVITLIIVYATAAWAIYSVYKSIKYKKASKCSGCAGVCGLKDYKITGTKRSLLETKQIKIENIRGNSKQQYVA